MNKKIIFFFISILLIAQHCFGAQNFLEQFMRAAQHGDTKTISKLLKQNKDYVNTKYSDGSTALHLAAQYNHVDTIILLIDNEAHIEARDEKGNTPLHTATQYRQLDAVQALLLKKANPNAQNLQADTPAHMIFDTIDTKSETIALSKKILQIFTLLKAYRAHINAQNIHGQTPLFKAIINGFKNKAIDNGFKSFDDNLIDELIDAEADYMQPDHHHTVSFEVDIEKSDLKVTTIFKKKIDLEILDIRIRREKEYKLTMLSFFKSQGAKIRSFQERDQKTIQNQRFLEAAQACDVKTMKKLLNNGADPDACNEDKVTAFHYMTLKDCTEGMQLLSQHSRAFIYYQDGDLETPMHWACRHNSIKTATMLMGKTDVARQDKHGNLPLHYAAQFAGKEMIELLLQKDKNTIDALNKQRETPLNCAITAKNIHTISALIQAGADKTIIGNDAQQELKQIMQPSQTSNCLIQ